MTAEGVSEAKLNSMISKVRKLIAKAEDPTTTKPESAAFRTKAEQIMQDYRIEEENLIAVDQIKITPIIRSFPVCGNQSPFEEWLWTLFMQAVTHIGGMVCSGYEKNSNGSWEIVGKVAGYDSDLRYLDLLWSSMRLSFIARLEPEYNPKLSENENIYRLRGSGIPRKDVAEMVYGKWTHANSAKVGQIYKDECRLRGEDPALSGRGIDLKTYRGVYAREFVYRVWDRLRAARDGALATGGAVDLPGRKERVEEVFYDRFPKLRPQPLAPLTEEPPTEEATKARKRVAKPYHETRAYKEKVRREYDSPAARAGASVGRLAGDSVNISRTAPRTDRVEADAADESINKRAGIEG